MHTNIQHLSFAEPLVNAAGTVLMATDHGGVGLRNFTPDIARTSGYTTYVIPSMRYELPLVLPDISTTTTTKYILSSGNTGSAEMCIGFRYEPELNMADTTEATYTPDASASDGAIFGFRNVHANAVRDAKRMGFNAVDFGTPATVTPVMSNVWPQNQISRWGADNFENTQLMHLVVNLRRGNAAPDDNTGNQDDAVLRIRLPYRLGHTAAFSNNIQFDSIPDGASASIQLNSADIDFGLRKPPLGATAGTRELVITRRMIPSTSAARRDITLVAKFTCDDNTTPHNPYFKQGAGTNFEDGTDDTRITSMDVEVDYVTSIDVAVDFVGIRTERAHHWLCGHYDDLIRAAHDEAIFQFTRFNALTGLNYRIHRFYGKDEAIPSFWEGLRYFNLRMDRLAITEVGTEWPKRYLHHTKIDRLWQGATLRLDGTSSTPAIWQGNNIGDKTHWYRYNRMGNGYNSDGGFGTTPTWVWNHAPSIPGNYFRRDYEVLANDRRIAGVGTSPDTLNCDLPMDPIGIDTSICTWDGVMAFTANTPLSALERVLTHQRYHGSYLFDPNMVWYANVWTEVEAYRNNLPTSLHFGYRFNRPKSSEEIRLQTWNQVILGAKALLFFYGPSHRPTDVSGHTEAIISLGLTRTVERSWFNMDGTMGTTLNSFTNASSQLGYDFIPNNPSNPANDTIIGLASCMTNEAEVVDFNYYRSYQHVAPDRFYVGMLSSRMEAARCLTQIKNIGDSLINLRLKAWKAVGYRRWVAGDSVLMSKYLDLDSTHQFVRQVGRTNAAGYPEAEHIDSMFYDITLHSKVGLNADSIFYIGVLNRRTNPRVKTPLPASTLAEDSTLFYSGEEWRQRVRAGTSNRFAQLGCRQIRIPFHYTKKAGAYNLRIREVSWDTSVYSGARIDTTVGSDVPLEAMFYPGEGKFFRVEAVAAAGNYAKGFLDHSNQRKIVAFPVVRKMDTLVDPKDSRQYLRMVTGDSVRYHTVYHRRPTTGVIPNTETGPATVYYQRSQPVHVSKANVANVQSFVDASTLEWETPIILNDLITYTKFDNSTEEIGGSSCGYPSLVVRCDTAIGTGADTSRVYVVYGCEYRPEITDPMKVLVCETILPADAPAASQVAYHATHTGHVLATTHAPTYPYLTNWGTPMINASAGGNFYCWSDSSLGIGYGFKLPDQVEFSPVQTAYVRAMPGLMATHPSLNSYSRLYIGEDDAAMVWQEGPNESDGNFIFYTRLSHDNAPPYAPHMFLNEGGVGNRMFMNTVPLIDVANANIIMLTDSYITLNGEEVGLGKHAFPVIYRHLSDWETLTGSTLDSLRQVHNKCDRVYWQTQRVAPIGKWMIARRPVDIREWFAATGDSDRFWSLATNYILDVENNLLGPDISQGMQ